MAEHLLQQPVLPILHDTTESGKERDWKGKKLKSQELAKQLKECWYDDMEQVGVPREDAQTMLYDYDMYIQNTWLKKADRTNRCADILTFQKTEEGRLKLFQAWFCKDRLCPMCNWRRAMKFAYEIGEILNEMQRRKVTGKPIFLTPTMRNVKGEDIGRSLSHFALSFQRLMKYKRVSACNIGAIRTTELTYNSSKDTYNIHVHCLIWMTPDYYDRDAGKYITQAEWTSLWQRAARLDYTPVVNVKAIKPKEPTERDPTGLYSAVLEVSKYPIKPDAFDALTVKTYKESPAAEKLRLRRLKELEQGMRGKRLISFFGLLKTIRKELGQTDDDEDLIGIGEDDEATAGQNTEVLVAEWDRTRREYYTRIEQRTPEELRLTPERRKKKKKGAQ